MLTLLIFCYFESSSSPSSSGAKSSIGKLASTKPSITFIFGNACLVKATMKIQNNKK